MSQLRQDIISGDWVIIAADRARRPRTLDIKKARRLPTPKSTCPFEDPEKSNGTPAILKFPYHKSWEIMVVGNKYPALEHRGECAKPFHDGLYLAEEGVGSHELIITRDHNKTFADLSPRMAAETMAVFQARHHAAAEDPCSAYASTFFNYGPGAGASLWHPHYQFMSLPFVPPRILHSLRGAKKYFKEHGRCVRCDVMKEEKKYEKRVIAENQFAIAFAPYASKRPFEVAIFPKGHISHFEKTSPAALAGIAAILQTALRRIRKNANDPDLNFFIHDAPMDGHDYSYHHWHIEIMPDVSVFGGLEFSTNVDINIVDPDTAAKILRK